MSKIALVDDDHNILISVSMTLETEGFDVETFTDGQTALDAFNRAMPDLAILDIKMPRMDGMDLLQRLRQKSSLPVIFLTSKDDEIDEILGLRMGADDYVTKPFSQRLLLERIRSLLRRKDANEGKITSDESEETKVLSRGELAMHPLRTPSPCVCNARFGGSGPLRDHGFALSMLCKGVLAICVLLNMYFTFCASAFFLE